LAADSIHQFEDQIESLTILPSSGGRYEVIVNGVLIYSKLETGRHAETGEVVRLLQKYLKEGKP
jgi:selenoprotein W-related protein